MIEQDDIKFNEPAFPISEMQAAIDAGYEGYVVESDQHNLVYKAALPEPIPVTVLPSTITVTTDSKSRKLFLQHLSDQTKFPVQLQFVPMDEEEIVAPTPDKVALQKTKAAHTEHALGIDSLTIIPGNEHSTKPRSIEEVALNFRLIYEYTKQHTLDLAYYYLNSAAVLLHGNIHYIGKSAMAIGLDLEKLQFLLTDEGMKTYYEIANSFQDKQAYPEYATSLLNIGGGIALPILTRLGMIRSINGVSFDSDSVNPRSASAFKSAYRTALVGGGDSIYKAVFGLNISEASSTWSWLEDRVAQILSQ